MLYYLHPKCFVQAYSDSVNGLCRQHILCAGLVFSEGCGSSEPFLHIVPRFESTFEMVGICRSVWNGLSVG